MQSDSREANEERPATESRHPQELTVKVIPSDEAKRLFDDIHIKYKKAFDLLKDR